MMDYKVRDSNDVVIGQYRQSKPPKKPDGWDGEWHVEEAGELNDELVEWWDER